MDNIKTVHTYEQIEAGWKTLSWPRKIGIYRHVYNLHRWEKQNLDLNHRFRISTEKYLDLTTDSEIITYKTVSFETIEDPNIDFYQPNNGLLLDFRLKAKHNLSIVLVRELPYTISDKELKTIKEWGS